MLEIGEWTVIALFLVPFVAGYLLGLKISRMKLIIFLLKRLEAREFEKLIDDGEKENENERCGTTDIGKMSSISGKSPN